MSPGVLELRAIRKQMELSQEELARRIGSSGPHVCLMESGIRHSPDKLEDIVRICYGLKLAPADDKRLFEALLASPRQVRIPPSAPAETFLLLAALRDTIDRLPPAIAMQLRSCLLELNREID